LEIKVLDLEQSCIFSPYNDIEPENV